MTTQQQGKIDLKGKTALITGASRGIGEATARHLASKGVNLILTARSINDLERIAKEIRDSGGKAIAVQVDTARHSDNTKAFELGEKEFGGIDFVFANAAYEGSSKPFLELPFEEFEHDLAVIINGNYSVLRNSIEQFRKRGGGSIVFVSSIDATLQNSTYINEFSDSALTFSYGPSKALLDALTRACSVLLKENIRVYGILPGVFDTQMSHKFAAKTGKEDIQSLTVFNPLFKTPGKPEYIAALVERLFDNTSVFPPNTRIMIDNDAYYNAHEHYKVIETNEPLKIDQSKVYNVFTNQPYDFSSNPK